MAKITEEIEDLILSLRVDDQGHPRSAVAISAELLARGIELSNVSVGKVIKARRAMREEAIRETIQEAAAPFVMVDLDVFQHNLEIELQLLADARPTVVTTDEGKRKLDCPMPIKDYTALLREARETANDRLKHAAGMQGDDSADTTAAMLAGFYGVDDEPAAEEPGAGQGPS